MLLFLQLLVHFNSLFYSLIHESGTNLLLSVWLSMQEVCGPEEETFSFTYAHHLHLHFLQVAK